MQAYYCIYFCLAELLVVTTCNKRADEKHFTFLLRGALGPGLAGLCLKTALPVSGCLHILQV